MDTACKSILISGIANGKDPAPQMHIYPNPYSDYTNIVYYLEKQSQVQLAVYNVMGKHVADLQRGAQVQGIQHYRFSAAEHGFPPGLYLVNLVVDGRIRTRTVLEIK
jgi:hypothetical protein